MQKMRVNLARYRRERLLELLAFGSNLTQCAQILQCNVSTISRDLKHLREHARTNIIKRNRDVALEIDKISVIVDYAFAQTRKIIENCTDDKQKLEAIHSLLELIEARKWIAEGSVNVEKYLQTALDERPKSAPLCREEISNAAPPMTP